MSKTVEKAPNQETIQAYIRICFRGSFTCDDVYSDEILNAADLDLYAVLDKMVGEGELVDVSPELPIGQAQTHADMVYAWV